MPSKLPGAIAAASLLLAATAAAAQSAGPQPAGSLSLATNPAVERAGVGVEGSNQLVGTTGWILAAVALGLVIWGIIEITSDDEDSPSSP